MHSSGRRANVEVITTLIEGVTFHQQIRQMCLAGSKSVELTESGLRRPHRTLRIEHKDHNCRFAGTQSRPGLVHTAHHQGEGSPPGFALNRHNCVSEREIPEHGGPGCLLYELSQRWVRALARLQRALSSHLQTVACGNEVLRYPVREQELARAAGHRHADVQYVERLKTDQGQEATF